MRENTVGGRVDLGRWGPQRRWGTVPMRMPGPPRVAGVPEVIISVPRTMAPRSAEGKLKCKLYVMEKLLNTRLTGDPHQGLEKSFPGNWITDNFRKS